LGNWANDAVNNERVEKTAMVKKLVLTTDHCQLATEKSPAGQKKANSMTGGEG